jgi:methyl-accepting chemotaxis protein
MSAAGSGGSTGPDAGAPGQDDPAALVEDINRTRAELGDTVEALVAKVDVKAQAKQRVAEASTQAKEKLQTMKQGLAGQASQLTGTAKRVTGTAEQARHAAAANGKTMLGAGAAGGQTVQRGAQRAGQAIGRYRIPVAAATATIAVALAGWLVVRRRRR